MMHKLTLASEIPDMSSGLNAKALTNQMAVSLATTADLVLNPEKEVIYQILDKIIHDIEKRLSNDQIKLSLTDKAKDYLVDAGYDINYGARPLKREVSKTIESLLAHELIKGTIPFNATVTFDVEDNNLIISKVDVK